MLKNQLKMLALALWIAIYIEGAAANGTRVCLAAGGTHKYNTSNYVVMFLVLGMIEIVQWA